MNKIVAMIIISLLLLSAIAAFAVVVFMQQPRFGETPQGKDLARIQQSPNYVNDAFQNQLATPVLKDGETTLSIIVKNLFSSAKNLRPTQSIPTNKTDLLALNPQQDLIIWLGHSSYYLQLDGQRILVDPVLSSYASPLSFAVKAFNGTSLYSVEELPEIDLLLITHDHWDHLDYATITALQPKVARVFMPLGLAAHFQAWGYSDEKLQQADWYDSVQLSEQFSVHLVPARHYSGRSFTKNQSLWGGFVLESSSKRIYLSGDTGYGPHFEQLKDKFGSFDLVALDMGQYDPRWPYIHMTPAEAAKAAKLLNAKALLPAHVGRFNLAQHAWQEPFDAISAESETAAYQLLLPEIGQTMSLNALPETTTPWWR